MSVNHLEIIILYWLIDWSIDWFQIATDNDGSTKGFGFIQYDKVEDAAKYDHYSTHLRVTPDTVLTGYPVNDAGYPVNDAGYPVNNAEYPVNNAGYPVNNVGYPINK